MKRLLAAIVASVSFSLAIVAFVLGVADLAIVSAHVPMQAWESERRMNDPESWEYAYDRLRLARRLNPLEASNSADLGRLMEWQSWHHSPTSPEYAANRQAAVRYYRETISKRPSWGYAWAHYAENRFLQSGMDEEFLFALKRATELAPWEPGVQRKVAWMGMALWDDLPNEMRGIVKENVRRAVTLDSFRYEIVRLAVQYSWLEHLKPMMQTENQLATLEFVLNHLDSHRSD